MASVTYVYWARTAVESHSAPVVELECEDAGRSAYLKHHCACSRAVYGAVGYQKVVVLLGFPLVDVAFHIKFAARPLRLIKCGYHFFAVNTGLQAEIHMRIFFGIEQIVALILCIIYAECVAYILCGGVNLQAQIAALHSVEKVESYRKILSKSRFHRCTKQFAGLIIHHIHRRHLKECSVYFKIQTIFLGHAVEAPSVVGHRGIKSAHALHPLSAPWRGIEEGNHTKWLVCCHSQTFAKHFAAYHLWLAGYVGVEPIIGYRQHLLLEPVAHYPIHKVASLILAARLLFAVIHSQTMYLMAAGSLLIFPPCHIGIHQHIGSPCHIIGSVTVYHHSPAGLRHAIAHFLNFGFVEKVGIGKWSSVSEYSVIGNPRLGHCPYLRLRFI